MTTPESERKNIGLVKSFSIRSVNEVPKNIVNRIEHIFQQWNDEQQKMDDCFDDIKPWKKFIPHQWFDSIEQKLFDFNDEKSKLERQLSNLLVEIRSTSVEESETIKRIKAFNQHSSLSKLSETFFDESRRIITKIKTLTIISPNKTELLSNINSIEDLIQEFYHNDLYLLHICEKWQKDDEENSFKQIRYFINLKKIEQDAQNNNAKFWVIDHDLHSNLKIKKNPENSVIYYATSGSIKSEDFYKDPLKTLYCKQIERTLNQYSNLTKQKLIDRHKQFIKDYPDGEPSKDDFMHEFQKIFPRFVTELPANIVNPIENIFRQWNDDRRKVNDCFDDIKPWKEFIPHQWFDLIKQKLSDFNEEELKLKCELSKLLVEIRSSTVDESKTIKLINDFNQRSCLSKLCEKFFDDSRRIITKIKTLTRISPNKTELLTKINSIEDLIKDFYDDDLYFLHICEKWQNEKEQNSFKQIRYFINLKKIEQDAKNSNAKFWVIDHDLHSNLKKKPENSVIYYATSGSIKSEDFYKDSLITLSHKQIERILNQYSNLTEQDLIDRHEQFIKDYPDGELSKDDFIHEFQNFFPEGNSKNFWEFAFPTIDKYKNDKINFFEFITAVALTHPDPCGTETRFQLVFSICDSNCSGTIGARKIIKFIEVIGELTNGPSAANTSAAKSIAEQIMNMCNKDKDGTVTKKEFIDCCKRRINIAIAFLPNLEMFDTEKWKQEGITMAGGNGRGTKLNQLDFPFSIFLDDDQTIYIADWYNHRIAEWKCNATNCEIVAVGNQTNQLNYPINVIIDKKNNSFIISDPKNKRVMQWSRQNNTIDAKIIIKDIDCWGLAMDKDGSLYVSDYKKNKVIRWKKGDQNGTIVAGGKKDGEEHYLKQLNYPTYIFVDENDSLYVSDVGNHRVMKWLRNAKEGTVVAGGNGNGSSLAQLSYPQGLIVDQLGQIYVADSKNHRVMRWCNGAEEGTIVVGGNGKGQQSNQFNGPVGLSFDRQGNLYVVDRLNNRIQKFEIN